MRDPKRIPRIIEALRRYWTRYPDLRLGQIVGNFTPRHSSGTPGNSYNVEDTTLEEELMRALKESWT